ncbi:hypothetical protein C8Z91_35200 [Paenibacillus elgii]|uniref:Carrier domain-containing protein n=1 Tax=Paenibacillus elgii TaxID=189691 RepID=A0A2T6FRI5_9BACL|nr:acyl carrier protein [Paenibacillus elgii]PUA34486.1 hypothetical protein C8Z91_35200 [Paenibacillus elgii]
MTIAEFTSQFEELLMLGKGQLTPDFVLKDSMNWDSMAIIETISLIDDHLDIEISTERLIGCKTFGDILNLLRDKLN